MVLAQSLSSTINLLYKVNSPLKEHVPDIVTSGDDCFSFGVWRKKQFELRSSEAISEARIWPYLVTRRCKGDIFAHIRNTLSKDDVLHLASFLGDVALLLDLERDVDGLYRICCSPPWIHSDIMDDNTHMEPVLPMNGFDEGALKGGSIGNGDPLYDLIPLYLDVFRGDVSLLKKFLESYNLPLSRRAPDHTPPYCGCDCILHKENVLEAILCLWKELRTATFWQVVEEAIWGKLNNYQSTLT
uniref:Uncharacterized protein n=1 Tax=Ananas comosus var. bracteatus TaxID=296719 RepID=A0A6V7NP62_ANACO|nr:unnamed protein product [Ananas comosus var. bracteatus]